MFFSHRICVGTVETDRTSDTAECLLTEQEEQAGHVRRPSALPWRRPAEPPPESGPSDKIR